MFLKDRVPKGILKDLHELNSLPECETGNGLLRTQELILGTLMGIEFRCVPCGSRSQSWDRRLGRELTLRQISAQTQDEL